LVFALTFFAYIHARINLLSVTLASICIWLATLLVRWLARRVRTGKVDIDRMKGRLPRMRGAVYKAASKVPFIGVRRPPFEALIGVNLEIGKGMFGLLGPNGAGKTTLMRIVTRVLEPTYGSVSLNGVNVKEWESLQGIVGYLPQSFGLYDHMSAHEYLDYRALLEGLRGEAERHDRILWCLQQVHLQDRKDDLIGSYSGGMRQRVGIAQTLLHMPRVIVVDEPTAGLDPVERIRFRNLLARLSQDRIVIFSTHIVEDVAGSCNRLAVLNKGRVLYSGTPTSMRELARDRVWEAVLSEEEFHAVEPDLRLISHVRTPAGIRARFLARQPSQGLVAECVEPTLEDAYLHLLQESRGFA
jgi:ABC-type multidrug transport system ATPase subunit